MAACSDSQLTLSLLHLLPSPPGAHRGSSKSASALLWEGGGWLENQRLQSPWPTLLPCKQPAYFISYCMQKSLRARGQLKASAGHADQGGELRALPCIKGSEKSCANCSPPPSHHFPRFGFQSPPLLPSPILNSRTVYPPLFQEITSLLETLSEGDGRSLACSPQIMNTQEGG